MPHLSKDFFCIVDRAKVELAAVITSYLATAGVYIPFFEFPSTTIGKILGDDTARDRHEMSRRRAYLFGVMVKNAFSEGGGAENLILAGLSAEQESFLSLDYPGVNVIRLRDVQSAELSLGGFAMEKKVLPCRSENIFQGLQVALRYNWILKIDEAAPPIISLPDDSNALVVIEAIPAVASVIAINYACFIRANLRLVEPLADHEDIEIRYSIEQWKGEKTAPEARERERLNLQERITIRVGTVDFNRYLYCTFFTAGLPYSLFIDSPTKFSYVHLLWQMDRFIFNALLVEDERRIFSAVLFSPLAFGEKEETTTVKAILAGHNYLTKSLFGEKATASNLDFHVKDYPYDLLHICSHGGDVLGEYCGVEIKDEHGVQHRLEVDVVRSFHPGGPGRFIPIPTKFYFRKYDGHEWGSAEYKETGKIDPELFIRFRAELEYLSNVGKLQGYKRKVPNSSCILCKDFPFLGMFDVCAGGRASPFVFNNACYSGYEMAEPFIEGGTHAYIGTLWDVGSDIATEVGQEFYSTVFRSTILEAFHRAIQKAVGSPSEGVYLFWGLHISTLRVGKSVDYSKQATTSLLIQGFRWSLDKAMGHINKEIRINSFRRARVLRLYLLDELGIDVTPIIKQDSKRH